MVPYKGYLIDTYADIVQMASGFGAGVQGPKMQVWRTRIIEATTGAITMLPEGSSEQKAKIHIDTLLDPTGKIKEREYVYNVIKATKAEIADIESNIEHEQKCLASLSEQLERLKAEHKALGGSDE